MNVAPKRLTDKLWLRGNLSWKYHTAQEYLNEKYNNIPNQLFVGNCSRQWGKSFWAVTKAIETAIKIPRAQIRYGAAFRTDLSDFIIPAFEKILDDAPEEVKAKKVGNFYVFPNGSKIKLVGLDKNPNGLRGNSLDLIIVDECGFVSRLDYIYKSVIIPATTHRPNCKIIFISTPPSTPAHTFVDYVQKAEVEGSYVKFDIYSNPLITTDDVERLAKEMGGKDSTTFRRECLCEFILDDDSAIVREWRDEFAQIVERDEYYNYYHKYVGMDLGRKHFTANVFGYYEFKKARLVIEDESTMEGKTWTTITLKDAIKAKEKELWGNVDAEGVDVRDGNGKIIPFRRVSDNNNPHLIMDLGSLHNLYFAETTKESLEAMVNEVRMMVKDGQIVVHPRCKMLIGCLKYGVWDAKRKEFGESKVYGHFDHLAALIYLVRNLAKSSNPIPATHGFEHYKAWTKNIETQKSHNAQVLSKSLIPKKAQVNTSLRKRGFNGR